MNSSFEDITKQLGEPKWYDDLGYPRYCIFNPDKISNIYACCTALLTISCQGCGREFEVAVNYTDHNFYRCFGEKMRAVAGTDNFQINKFIVPFLNTLTPEDFANAFHYGDPPNHGCIGDSMNVFDLRINQFWLRLKLDWKRYKQFEIEMEKP